MSPVMLAGLVAAGLAGGAVAVVAWGVAYDVLLVGMRRALTDVEDLLPFAGGLVVWAALFAVLIRAVLSLAARTGPGAAVLGALSGGVGAVSAAAGAAGGVGANRTLAGDTILLLLLSGWPMAAVATFGAWRRPRRRVRAAFWLIATPVGTAVATLPLLYASAPIAGLLTYPLTVAAGYRYPSDRGIAFPGLALIAVGVAAVVTAVVQRHHAVPAPAGPTPSMSGPGRS